MDVLEKPFWTPASAKLWEAQRRAVALSRPIEAAASTRASFGTPVPGPKQRASEARALEFPGAGKGNHLGGETKGYMAVGQTLCEHQNSWQMDFHPPQNGAIGFAHGHIGVERRCGRGIVGVAGMVGVGGGVGIVGGG